MASEQTVLYNALIIIVHSVTTVTEFAVETTICQQVMNMCVFVGEDRDIMGAVSFTTHRSPKASYSDAEMITECSEHSSVLS